MVCFVLIILYLGCRSRHWSKSTTLVFCLDIYLLSGYILCFSEVWYGSWCFFIMFYLSMPQI